MIIIFTARNSIGETFTITKMNVERMKQEERLFCKSCASPVMIKAGQIKIPHFAHEKTMKCAFASEGESEEHLAAKRQMMAWFCYQGLPVELESYFPEINRQADIFVNGKTVIEFQRSSVPISEMIQRTMDYLSLGLEVHWILGQTLKKDKGRICLSAFQQAFIQFDQKLGYHFWHYSVEHENCTLYYHLTFEKGNRFFASEMPFSMKVSFSEWKKKIARIITRHAYVKRDREFERQKICFYYAKFKKHGQFMQKLYNAGYYLHYLPKEIGVDLEEQFLVMTPAIEWQFDLWDNFFKGLEKGDTFSGECFLESFQSVVTQIQTIWLSPNENLKLGKAYISYLISKGVLAEIPENRYRVKRKMTFTNNRVGQI
ncbi:competence protein CoiA [Listeria swaminathanii]|uniref:Competence protein CoiA n=1 Tax=Listeria swaminathanii TaxID=2713501 RepID=A0ABU2IFT8_9LIST|nr:competence protein CoiA [Listeria swaminathanii]MDT0018120.1 competence protein CoiA [Listeria swaminathanii]MDT0022515.1 competence protein CoiA [Listeria swaminathanii]MDT0033479.1 competence protein CoiA [Listeria swaminathanii]MDT0052569.1 competence protein CoiA [Listeria swaminathanii]MDT0055334.1 competence protein CoiA [Listeria swaminathanii]